MPKALELDILPQPDEITCGPTCLHALYRYYGAELPLEQVVRETPRLDGGGTLAVLLGCDALRRGYQATLYTFNLNVFDPTWFHPLRAPEGPSGGTNGSLAAQAKQSQADVDVREKLLAQMAAKNDPKLRIASQAYVEFCELGGQLRMQDLSASLIRRYLKRSVPILTGLSATYLHYCPRELGLARDDIRGEPLGHFVVLCGYDKQRKTVRVADPYLHHPVMTEHYYDVGLDRLVCAILLGVLTYDANLLIIEPANSNGRELASFSS
jgi:hypothetical protein